MCFTVVFNYNLINVIFYIQYTVRKQSRTLGFGISILLPVIRHFIKSILGVATPPTRQTASSRVHQVTKRKQDYSLPSFLTQFFDVCTQIAQSSAC